jgi:hypothetical protein
MTEAYYDREFRRLADKLLWEPEMNDFFVVDEDDNEVKIVIDDEDDEILSCIWLPRLDQLLAEVRKKWGDIREYRFEFDDVTGLIHFIAWKRDEGPSTLIPIHKHTEGYGMTEEAAVLCALEGDEQYLKSIGLEKGLPSLGKDHPKKT